MIGGAVTARSLRVWTAPADACQHAGTLARRVARLFAAELPYRT